MTRGHGGATRGIEASRGATQPNRGRTTITTTEKATGAEAKAKAKARKKRTRKKRTGGTQAQAIVARLRHKNGATVDQLMEASGASRRNVQWYLSQYVKRKLGLPLVREGEVYRIAGRPRS